MAACSASREANGRWSQARSVTHGECSKIQPSFSTNAARGRALSSSRVMGVGGSDRRQNTIVGPTGPLYGPEDALRRGGTVQFHEAAISEGRDRVADGLARGNGQHE